MNIGTSEFVNWAPGALVVPPIQPADSRQAIYYRTVLDEQQAQVADEIANHYAALAKFRDCGDLPRMRRAILTIREKQKEQFELDCLREALERRFFPALATQARPVRCFDIDITRNGSWWRVHIPEINELTRARQRGQAERIAREQIAFSTATPIAKVAVRVISPVSR
jgi:hypothetical protein